MFSPVVRNCSFSTIQKQLLSIEPTLFSYRTHGLTDICTITKETFYDLMRIQPNLVLPIAASTSKLFTDINTCLYSSDGSTNVPISTSD